LKNFDLCARERYFLSLLAREASMVIADKSDKVRLKQVNPVWELRLIVTACVVGAALVIVGLWGEIAVKLDGILSATFMVSGLALIFGAFGSQATVQYKGWVVAGAAATALIFLFAIDYLRRDSIVIVDLQTSKDVTTTLTAGGQINKGIVDNFPQFIRTRFYVRYSEVMNDMPQFDTHWWTGNVPDTSLCFSKDRLTRWFGRGGQLDWRLSAANPQDGNMEILDRRNNSRIGSKLECGGENTSTARLPDFAIASAHAQPAADDEILIEDLLNENPDVRRLARSQLANLGPRVIRPLMDRAINMSASNDRLAFRMQVGAAVAIDTMFSRKVAPSEVAQQLRTGDFTALVKWTLNNDRSLRGPALRIFANTANVPALQELMRAIERETDEDVIYNTAWILRQSAQRYRADRTRLADIKQLARHLRSRAAGLEKTISFLDQIEAI
jgi:hypothetical protein